MQKHTTGQMFSKKTPTELARALQVVQAILDGKCEDLGIPLVGDGSGVTVQDALNQVQGVIKEEWVRLARVTWIETGLKNWHQWIKDHPDTGLFVGYYIPFQAPERDMMTHNTLNHFTTTAYVGCDRNRLLEENLHLLNTIRRSFTHQVDSTFLQTMRSVIDRRTCCDRPNHPHRDELARNMLLREYKLV